MVDSPQRIVGAICRAEQLLALFVAMIAARSSERDVRSVCPSRHLTVGVLHLIVDYFLNQFWRKIYG